VGRPRPLMMVQIYARRLAEEFIRTAFLIAKDFAS
jgi:hypothetical protein